MADTHGEDESRRPNVIVILTDDQGFNDLGVQGSRLIRTPYIDRMAAEGMRLTNFHAQPVCGPSRAALLTGCHPQRIGQIQNMRIGVGGGHPLLHPKETTIAEILNQQGYRTAMIGKWHLGMTDGSSPTEKGFDSFLGTPGSNDGPWVDIEKLEFADGVDRNAISLVYPSVPLIRDQTVVEFPLIQDGITTRYTDEAMRFVRSAHQADRPFFLYLAHNAPHIPLRPSSQFRGKSDYGLYGDSVEELDWNTGRILDLLRELQISENTLVVYTSDNGPWARPELVAERLAGSAWPLRGGKVTSWEGGFRVPFVAWMPGTIPAGHVSDEFCTTLDIMPTVAGMTGAVMPSDRKIDGHDVTSILTSVPETNTPYETFPFYVCRHLQAVKWKDWKLVLARPSKPELMMPLWASHFEQVEEPQLYYLKTDIGENTDVSARYPDIVDQMLGIADAYRSELGDGARIGDGERFWEAEPEPGAVVVNGPF